jgi:hypothetical protein
MVKIEIPKEEVAALCHRYHVRELALFGSVLRTDFSVNSDIDVLVEFEPEAEISLFDVSGMQIELTELFQRPVDLVLRDGLKALIRESVLSSAEAIYAKQ